jgi:NAD(P)-dependent dehydrogenase (short-subunit alcohol dehydrogenase family)
LKKFGKIDVLVNNAGLGKNGDILTTTLDQYDLVMNTNVRSVFHLTQLTVPHLIKTQGNVVNISSVAGPRQFPNLLAYCMSKAAIDQFTKCVALELAPKNVRVNAVNPAFIVTNFHKSLGMNDETYEKFKDRAAETHALGRAGTIDETSKAIAFLANNLESSFITGTCLLVDGGKAVMCPR